MDDLSMRAVNLGLRVLDRERCGHVGQSLTCVDPKPGHPLLFRKCVLRAASPKQFPEPIVMMHVASGKV